jgi:hypothetical protein
MDVNGFAFFAAIKILLEKVDTTGTILVFTVRKGMEWK